MTANFWQIQTTSCTGMGAGGTAALAGNVITLNALATAAGGDIKCVFTNAQAVPQLAVTKTASVSSVSTVGSAVSYTTAEIIYSDAAPTGNSTDAATNRSWDILAPGDDIEFTSNYVVVQADIDNLQ